MATRTTTKAPSGDRQVARKAGFTKGGVNPPARREDVAANTRSRLLPEERRRLIAETAYFIAERRGFSAGSELEDWLQAEAEVNRRLRGASPD
jgi:hypothetical protein